MQAAFLGVLHEFERVNGHFASLARFPYTYY